MFVVFFSSFSFFLSLVVFRGITGFGFFLPWDRLGDDEGFFFWGGGGLLGSSFPSPLGWDPS